MKKLIEIVFNPIPDKRIKILEKLLSLMKSTGMKMESLDTRYGNVSAEQYLSNVEIEGDWKYQFASDEIEVIHGEIGAYGLYHLMISEKSPGVIGDPRIWGGAFIDAPGFLSARVADCTYEYWQNAELLDEYVSGGRFYDVNKLVSNKLPYPLEGKVVNTSDNPGRRRLTLGYIEAIGYEMWLTDRFFELAGGFSLSKLQNAGWRVEGQEESIKHLSVDPIKLSEAGFLEDQMKLRAALFG